MHKNCLPPIHRIAAIGSAVAIVAASSAFGIGAVSASADELAPNTSVATSTSVDAPTATPAPTGAPTPAAAPVAPTNPTADAPAAGTPDAPTATTPAAPAAATPAAPGAATPAPTAAAAPTATPAGTVTITGTTRAWRTISADTAGWPTGTTFTYRWDFHHPVLGNRYPGTERTYVVDPEQADGTFTVTVTGTAPGMKPTSVTSAPSSTVIVEDADRQFIYDQRVVPVTSGEPFSVDLAPADNPDLSFFVNGSISGTADPSVLPAGVTLSENGVLSGTLDSSTPLSDQIWVHVSTPYHPGGGLSERILLSVAPAEDDGGLSFSGGSSEDHAVQLRGQAGTAFSHTFRATGGPADEPVRYSIVRPDGQPFPASDIGASFPAGITLDPTTGVLSGTDDQAASYSFAVVATSGGQSATQYVDLRTTPAPAVGALVTVTRPGDVREQRTWIVKPDGSVETTWFPNGPQHDIAQQAGGRPTAAQRSTLLIAAAPVDAFGNITVPLDGDWDGRTPIGVTSDVASDVVKRAGWNAEITFPHASTHTLTVTTQGVSTTFPVTVVPSAGAAGSGTTGSLAFTGADETGPITWGLGLLASGVALLTLRARRRRV
ncbi:putative Ig domain-containing protein [Curtobacterium sp. PsM8]|uniref:putative Ig domain-containing protein n=1 Tax=Curtobacterium sp. PsM8 TaxID=3030532 RepID=UPI00263ACE59|nr:putative Ig domain-containing protein [Curtobacterium sp. PsM8]MDN4648254.1 putative Ig domain-containing protein [Curtobacterium sp. PsM8]